MSSGKNEKSPFLVASPQAYPLHLSLKEKASKTQCKKYDISDMKITISINFLDVKARKGN